MSSQKELTIVEHLEELRLRLIKCVVALVSGALLSYGFVDSILYLITRLTMPYCKLIFLKPTEAFIVRIKVAFYVGLFFAFPVLVYQIWQFIRPGLHKKERKHVYWVIPSSYLLFCGGILFAYYLVLPTGIRFLLSYGTDQIQPLLSISDFLSFLTIFLLSFGIIFQFPLIVIFLTWIGLVTPGKMRAHYRIAVLIIFIVAAIITPGPDVFSQLMMVLPMLLFYEVSIWFSALVLRSKKKARISSPDIEE